MSEPTLPEDVRRWPEDPYELLGVQFGVLPRDLKRAYTRLIRMYKPEQSPDQFRMIREAYEKILKHIEWFGSREVSIVEPDDGDRAASETDSTVETRPAQSTLPPLQQGPAIERELVDLWEQACSGDERSAYGKLVQLHETHAGQVDICLRLYWLLSISPHLDDGRSPLDWLATGLKESNLAGPLRELYRREIIAEPEEALGRRFTELLQHHARPGTLADMLQWRWQAARKHVPGLDWAAQDIIVQDLELFWPRMSTSSGLSIQEEESWVRLLLLAVDYLAWSHDAPHRETLERCLKEIHSLDHLHTRLSGSLDRLDLLLDLSTTWRRLTEDRSERPNVLEIILDLTPSIWNGDLPELRSLLLDCLEQIARNPLQALQSLDFLRQNCSGALSQFGQLLSSFEQSIEPPADPRSPEQILSLVERFLDMVNWRNYTTSRGEFLTFLLREAISPEQMAESLDSRADLWINQDATLARVIQEDWPLRYVYRSCRAYWT
jgi:hypothetical protein